MLRLDGAVNPNARPDPNVDAVPGISVARKHGDDGWADLGLIFIATPELLAQYGLPPDAADDAGILTRFALPLDVMDLGDPPPPRDQARRRGHTIRHLDGAISIEPHQIEMRQVVKGGEIPRRQHLAIWLDLHAPH